MQTTLAPQWRSSERLVKFPSAPALPGRVRYMLATGAPNPWSKSTPKPIRKRTLVTDVSTGERIDVSDPAGEAAFQSIVWGIRNAGWSMEDAARLLLGHRLPGTRWLDAQPVPEREFIRSWHNADVSVQALQRHYGPGKFEVNPWLVDAVWAYILNHPGVGVREMRRDETLLPGVRASRRHGVIDAARKVLLDDERIRTEGGQPGQRLAHFSTVDKWTGEVLDEPAPDVSDAELDALVPRCSGARRVPLKRVCHNPSHVPTRTHVRVSAESRIRGRRRQQSARRGHEHDLPILQVKRAVRARGPTRISADG